MAEDLTGKHFGKWTVLAPSEKPQLSVLRKPRTKSSYDGDRFPKGEEKGGADH